MILTETVFSQQHDIKVALDFSVDTTLGLKWQELESSNVYAVDYGSSGDTYYAACNTYGNQAYVDNLYYVLQSVRNSDYVYLSNFADNEKMFGENIDYSGSLTATLLGFEANRTANFHVFNIQMAFKLYNPTFTGTSAFDFSTISAISYEYKGGRNLGINHYDTYNGVDYTYDKGYDKGSIKFNMNLTSDELVKLRNFQRIKRGETFSLTNLYGITYPFGEIAGAYPYNVKLYSVKERKFGLNRFLVDIELKEIKSC